MSKKLLRLIKRASHQRDSIFKLAGGYCWGSLVFLMLVIAVQTIVRITTDRHDFSIFDGNELQILVIGVFGQFVGLLYIITRSLYDDKNYIELFKNILNK